MTNTPDVADRLYAPEGRKKSVTLLLLLLSLMVALLVIVYLLLNQKTIQANASERVEKTVSTQLHTNDNAFTMPVFKATEPVKVDPEPEPEVAAVEVPALGFTLDPLPEPEPLVVPEALPTTTSIPVRSEVVQPIGDKPLTDEERRLASGVAGSKGVPSMTGSAQSSSGSAVGRTQVSGSGFASGDSASFSEYEYLENKPVTAGPEPSGDLSGDDLDRLDKLAAFYGVNRSSERRDSSPSYTRLSQSDSTERSVSSRPASGIKQTADFRSDEQDDGFTPINRTAAAQPREQGGGIDLSSTQVIASEARRIKLDYLLKRGTYISCVLSTRIVSDQAGYIRCSISENVYSADGSNLLLPRGSEVLGEYKPKSLSNGKVRLHAVWDAVTTPDGIRVNLASPSTGRLGATGISGQINNHYGQRVGIPILLSLFRTGIDYRTRNLSGESGEYQRTSSDAADDVLSDQMQQYEEIRPTLTQRQGSTIGIMVARDVSFEKVLTGSR